MSAYEMDPKFKDQVLFVSYIKNNNKFLILKCKSMNFLFLFLNMCLKMIIFTFLTDEVEFRNNCKWKLLNSSLRYC